MVFLGLRGRTCWVSVFPTMSSKAKSRNLPCTPSFLAPFTERVSPFPLSHMGRYTSMQERSLHFGRDDDTGIALSKHIRCTLREINPFPPTVISSAARNLPCTLLFLAPFAKRFPFSALKKANPPINLTNKDLLC